MKRLLMCVLSAIWLVQPIEANSEDSILAGTWKLVEFTNYEGGVATHPFGVSPIGYFIYTKAGFLSIQILKNPLPETLNTLSVTFSEQPSYVGYFGRYVVDKDLSYVTHQVEGGTILNYIGTDQKRPIRLDGDRLIIGVQGKWERVLVREE